MTHADMSMLEVVIDVLQALLPIIAFFLIFQFLFLKYPWVTLKRILIGVAITGGGMVLFLGGVFIGFIPIAREMGEFLVQNFDNWVIIAFGFLMGFLATYAEPAVRVLCGQVEKSSGGYISSTLILWTLSISVAAFVALGMARIVYQWDFRTIIIIGYLLVLVLMWKSEGNFVAIAFDSGGVATGPMAVSIIMTMAVGIATGVEGGNPIIDGFGIIALIALAPILFVTGLGALLKIKEERDELRD